MKNDRTKQETRQMRHNMHRRAEKVAMMGVKLHSVKPEEFGAAVDLLFEAVDVLQLQIEVM